MFDVRLLLLIGMTILLVVLLAYFAFILFKKKKYYGLIDELDYLKYEVSNKTVPFELAKLRSAQKSERIVNMVQQWEVRWEDLERQFITVTENIIYAEELISQRNFTAVNNMLAEIKSDLEKLNEEVNLLSNEIETLKESEERGRSIILELRKKYEEIKSQIDNEKNKYRPMKRELQQVFDEVELGFYKFDEYMEECNYNLADETMDFIKLKIDDLIHLHEKMPLYQESINRELQPLLKEVLNSYEYIAKSGIYLQHLQISETIKVYQEQLDNVMDWIKNFEFSELEEHLIEIHENAKQMIEYMKKEVGFQETIRNDLKQLENDVEIIAREGIALNERYDNIKINCTLPEEDEKKLLMVLNEISVISKTKNNILQKVKEKQTPTSILNQEIMSILNQINEIKEQLSKFDKEIAELYSGEKECRQRALYLLKHFNQVKGEYKQHIFPVDQDELQEAIGIGSRAIQMLFEVMGKVPIDINEIREHLEYTDKIIKDITDVLQNEMDQLTLAESLIVYGQRYVGREGMYLVELTIAEDQFRQGNYQNVIEKMYAFLSEIEGEKFKNLYSQMNMNISEKTVY